MANHMTPSAIYPGLVVKLVPSEFTRSRTNFVPGFDPMIGGVYRVESLDAEGLVYLESGAGPFLPGDLVPAAPDEMHNVVRISREFDMRARLEIGGVKVPGLSEGDRVFCTAQIESLANDDPDDGAQTEFPIAAGPAHRSRRLLL